MICTSSFARTKAQIVNFIHENNYSFIRGGTEQNNINFIVVAKEQYLGDSVIIFFDKNYKIKNYLLFCSRSGYQPVFISKKYLILGGIRNKDTGSSAIIVYEIRKNKIDYIDINFPLIWNFFIYEDEFFYSSEMAYPHLNVINLKTKEEYHCDDFYCPYAEFGFANGEVYAVCDDEEFYVYHSNQFIKTDTRPKDFKSEYYELNNFPINTDVIEKLH